MQADNHLMTRLVMRKTFTHDCAALKVTVTSRSACADETGIDRKLPYQVKQHSDHRYRSVSLCVTVADAAMRHK